MATIVLRTRAFLGAVAASILLVATMPSGAQAVASPDPVDTVSLSGDVVYDLVVLDSGRVIVGGRFHAIGSYSRSNLAAILPNGNADPDFAPRTDGQVRAIAVSEDGSRVFIGGTFTQVNGQPRHNLAAINPRTGALVSGWRADTGGRNPTVSSLAVSGGRLYVGGNFHTIDGNAKQMLAAIDVGSGDIERWSTWVNAPVNEVRVTRDGDTVWIGGDFTKIRGIERPYFGAINASTGQPTSFSGRDSTSRVITLTLSPDGRWVYTGHNDNRLNAYKVGSSEEPRWSRGMSGNVQAIAWTENTIYLGGHFHSFRDDGVPRVFFAALRRYSGETRSWNPKAEGFHKGVWSLDVHNGQLYAGGGFTKFDGVSQRLFAKFGGTA